MKRLHKLKVHPIFYRMQLSGVKKFEVRLNDREFKVDDYLLLAEYENEFSGRQMLVQVTCVIDFEQKEGYVILGTQFVEVIS